MTQNILVLAALLMIYFSLGWFLSYKTNKYAWIDFFWSSSFLLAVAFLWPQNILSPHGLISIMIGAWSVRLSYLLFTRIRKESEDPRYVKLKAKWASNTARNFFILYIFEGLLTLTLCIPLYIAASMPAGTELSTLNYLGAGLFALFLFGEALSDHQLTVFKRQHAGQKKVCDIGLWNYSRHPNYFFEIMIWFSYGVFSIGSGSPVLAFIPFVIMYVFISKITGVPYAEAQAIESRGDLYRDYQKRTNKLIPWFPKKESAQ